MAAGDLLAQVLSIEDDCVRNHRYSLAVLAFEVDFKFPMGQSHCLVWVRTGVQFLSVYVSLKGLSTLSSTLKERLFLSVTLSWFL